MLLNGFFILFSFSLLYLDGRIGKDDLRLKLMRKSALRRDESNDNDRNVDLREKLKKTAHPPTNSFNSKQHMPEPREASLFRPVPSARSSDDIIRMESMRNSYSPWTLDQIRQRSPEEYPSTSRGISPQRNVGDPQRRPLNRTYDGVRPVQYAGRDVLETSRPPSAAPSSFMPRSTMSTLPPVTAKPVPSHPGRLPPSGSVPQRPPFVVSFTYSLISRFILSNFIVMCCLEKTFPWPSDGCIGWICYALLS